MTRRLDRVRTEAEELFAEQVRRWRQQPWQNLRRQIRHPVAYDILGQSAVRYQFEVVVFWDDRPEGNLRVIVTGDDAKGWRALRRMRTDGFIKAPDDSFVGE